MEATTNWVRVTRQEPCCVCGNDYCTRSADGEAARCTRVESDRASPGKDGTMAWIHVLAEPLPKVTPKPTPVLEDVGRVVQRMYEHANAAAKRIEVAKQLGVSVEALERLRVGVGWDEHDSREFASFPSRDACGKFIGVTRRYVDGSKKTMAGTHNGIFAPDGWWKGRGPVLILEGASDVAAAIDAGLPAIGRSSNLGGKDIVKAMLRRKKIEKVLVVGENDFKLERHGTDKCPSTDCRGCNWCWPGKYGAAVFADALGCKYRMPPIAVKDFREWLSLKNRQKLVLEKWKIELDAT